MSYKPNSSSSSSGGGGGGGGSSAKRDSLKSNKLYRGKRDSVSGQSPTPSPDMQRRESLVKPTWQNISPGQVPVATLERLRKMSSGDDSLDQQRSQLHHKDKQQSNGGRDSAAAASTRLVSATTIIKCVQREEPCDVFGKVNQR